MNRYPQFQDVKLYLGIASSDDDALLAITLKRAITTFENLCGRTFNLETDVKFFDANSEQVLDWRTLFPRDDDMGLDMAELEKEGLINRGCPEGLLDLMGRCCKLDPSMRPDFTTIAKELEVLSANIQ